MRAEDLSTKRDVFASFRAAPSAQVMAVLVTAALIARISIRAVSWADVLVLGVSVTLLGVVEWGIHLFLLHAPVDSYRMRVLKTGIGHRQHHIDPGDLDFLLLGPVDTAVFGVMIAVGTGAFTLALSLLFAAAFDTPSVTGPVLTGILFAYVSLVHYEWTHLLVHTRYRPKTRYYQRLARNHRLHHYRNERYWLGVTSNLGDRIFRTYPKTKSGVPLSDTARSLG
jgi:hypothetical protein